VAWHKAKEAKDYSIFAPHLKRITELGRETAAAYGYKDRPYDAFIDLFEPGMNTAQIERMFADLKAFIVPLVREIASRQEAVDDSCLYRRYDDETQLRFGLEIAKHLGYDTERGGLAESAHPFTTTMGPGDVRITTRIISNDLDEGLMSTLHEAGHAMYEQGVSPSLVGTRLAHGASAGYARISISPLGEPCGAEPPISGLSFPTPARDFSAAARGCGHKHLLRSYQQSEAFPDSHRG